jgi:hypothetical protein
MFSCVALTTDYHVFSWQWRNNIRYKWRKHNEDNESFNEVFPFEKLNSFPKRFYNFLPELSTYNSGTIIFLKNCDRLPYRKAKTLISKLEFEVGRIYRNYFDAGVSIKINAFNESDNDLIKIDNLDTEVRNFDPLFLKTNLSAPLPYCSSPTSEPFGNEIIVRFNDDDGGVEHQIKIRGSLIKKEIQLADLSNEDNRKLSRLYNSVPPISLVRANKEIDSGYFGFSPFVTTDINNKWWKVEIQFDPISDFLLGTTSTKKTNFRYYSEDDYNDLHNDQKLIFALSMEVNKLILEMKKVIQEREKDSLNN